MVVRLIKHQRVQGGGQLFQLGIAHAGSAEHHAIAAAPGLARKDGFLAGDFRGIRNEDAVPVLGGGDAESTEDRLERWVCEVRNHDPNGVCFAKCEAAPHWIGLVLQFNSGGSNPCRDAGVHGGITVHDA